MDEIRQGSAALTEAIEAAAAALRHAAETATPCAPVRHTLGPAATAADAYAVQQRNVAHALKAGRRLAGRKIGLTARAVQLQLGVSEPDYGALFADMCLLEGEPIAPNRLLQPKVEGEVALVLERDLAMELPGPADVLRACAYALPAIEIVDSRIAGWDIRLVDTIADNASSGLFVLGGPARRLDGLDLAGTGMTMTLRRERCSTGTGADCLGSPLSAATWLARRMVALGTPLRAGDVLMTGALGPMVAAQPGDIFECTIRGLGSVRVALSEA